MDKINNNIESLDILDWNAIVTELQSFAVSEMAKVKMMELLEEQNWAQSKEQATLLQKETKEVGQIIDKRPFWSCLSELDSPLEALESLERAQVLELEDIHLVYRWLLAIDTWVNIPKIDLPSLVKKAIDQMIDPDLLIRELSPILGDHNELSEQASPVYRELKKKIIQLQTQIETELNYLIQKFTQKGLLQESFYDKREGRYVLPFKVSEQSSVSGRVVGSSMSRQTAYIEPVEIEKLSIELSLSQARLSEEIYRILKEKSLFLTEYASEIIHSIDLIVYWDQVAAKAKMAREFSGKEIEITDHDFELNNVAHPLLWKTLEENQIIKNSIELKSPTQMMMITGPNTGGKTVLLKTIGIACVFARTGIAFPGSNRHQVPFIDTFFVDLGDPQSIEKSLSSFSGHILKMKKILSHAHQNSLILLDELNSATDPEEGACLSRAIIEALLEKNVFIVTTTHDPLLKNFSLEDKRILPVSMLFDEKEQLPTYQIKEGVPGRSRALETADRLGIPKEILKKAKSYLSETHVAFENKLSQLDQIFELADKEKKRAAHLREEAERLKNEWETRVEKTFTDVMDRSKRRVKQITEEVQDQVREILKQIQETRNKKTIDRGREKISNLLSQTDSLFTDAIKKEAPEESDILEKNRVPELEKPMIEVGVRVKVPKWKSHGTVVEMKGKKIKVRLETLTGEVHSGMAVQLMTDEVEVLSHAQQQLQNKKVETDIESGQLSSSQMDIRGIRFEQAMQMVEAFLDQSVRSSCLQVKIIHGVGTGALREGTREILSRLPYVKDYRDATSGDGGAGVTVVEFSK